MRWLFIVVGALSTALCSNESSRAIPTFYDFGTDYSFRLSAVNESGIDGLSHLRVFERVDTRGDRIDGERIAGFASVPGYGFWLDVTNKTGKPIRLLWTDARYIDEVGQRHTVYHYVIGERPPSDLLTPGAPTELAPGATTRQVVSPGYKTYMIEEGGEEHVFEEPLVPTTLKGRAPEQMKAHVDDLARRKIPVKLLLPMDIDGKRYEYIFTFGLKPRRANLPKQ